MSVMWLYVCILQIHLSHNLKKQYWISTIITVLRFHFELVTNAIVAKLRRESHALWAKISGATGDPTPVTPRIQWCTLVTLKIGPS